MEDSNKVLYTILTERLELLRQLDKEGDSDRRRHIAKETQNLHAPMAHRLGLYQIKTEMEDLALKFLDYDTYKYIAHALNAKKAEREAYIASFIAPLEEKLKAEGFVFTIKGRPKSIHSIYHKMQAQHCDVDRIYDLFAIRTAFMICSLSVLFWILRRSARNRIAGRFIRLLRMSSRLTPNVCAIGFRFRKRMDMNRSIRPYWVLKTDG